MQDRSRGFREELIRQRDASGNGKQPHFCGGVKSQSKEEAHEEHMPRFGDATKESGTTSGVKSHRMMRMSFTLSSPKLPQLPGRIEIHQSNDQQKSTGDAAANETPELLEELHLLAHELLSQDDAAASQQDNS